jgi:hypothetical protein
MTPTEAAAGGPPGGTSPPGAWQYQDWEAPPGTAQQAGARSYFEPDAVPCPAHPGKPLGFAHRNGQRIQDVKRAFASACQRAGITDFRIHDLRHTCAAWLVSADVSLAEVRDLLGHTTIKMTERYAHLAPENVRVAVSVLEGNVSRSGHARNRKFLQGVLSP